MTQRRLLSVLTILGATAALAAAGSGPALGAPPAVQRFHVEASFALTPLGPVPPCAPTRGRNLGAGSAVGTQVGAGTWASDECADFTTRPGFVIAVGQATLTASDGARLLLRYAVQTPFPDAAGAIRPVGGFVVAGGTGRFRGATGAGVLRADGNVFTLTQVATLDGVIRLR